MSQDTRTCTGDSKGESPVDACLSGDSESNEDKLGQQIELDCSLFDDEQESPQLLQGLMARRQRRRPTPCMTDFSIHNEESDDRFFLRGLQRGISVATPSSCSSISYLRAPTPGTPDPERAQLKSIAGEVDAVMFDFDGTLTASPGDLAQRCRKHVELRERASMLAPRLQKLTDSGLLLGIISKSSEQTIRGSLVEAGLTPLFEGPVLGKAVGFEGKAGFIEEQVRTGDLHRNGCADVRRVLLVDDDVRELDRARAKGIQTWAAPATGGLQEEDFDEIFVNLGLRVMSRPASRAQSPYGPVALGHQAAPQVAASHFDVAPPLLPPAPPVLERRASE